jgi:hypothetical protein
VEASRDMGARLGERARERSGEPGMERVGEPGRERMGEPGRERERERAGEREPERWERRVGLLAPELPGGVSSSPRLIWLLEQIQWETGERVRVGTLGSREGGEGGGRDLAAGERAG